MEKKGLPIVLLLGAKGQHVSLDAVPGELNKIHSTLFSKQGDKPPFELVLLPYFTRSDLHQTLNQLKNRIAVLHFAGHSNDQGLVTDGVEENHHTSANDPELVYSRHICKHIRSWSQAPALVFLNGCRNAAQVEQFHQAGVAVVIATHRPINDGEASTFAQAFYQSLFSDSSTSLHAAFEQAGANALSENRGVRSCDIDEIDDADAASLDWSPYPQHVEQLNWTLVELLTNERPVLDANGRLINPYKGLEAFQQKDKAWFFGREQLTTELTKIIPGTPFYTLMGASGSGKSSLINAGAVPALEESGEYLILQCRPGAAPFEELAQALALVLYPDVVERIPKQKELFAGLQVQEIQLLDLVPALLQKSGTNRLCLMVDQFEELFTQSRDHQDRIIQPYIAQLVALIESGADCTLALIMRADFLTAAMAYTDFAKLINNYPHTLLPPMSQAELRAAIERPAVKQHVALEPALTEALLDAVDNQAGSLPLLQYVLSLLWEKRNGRVIWLDDYNAFGGLEKALERRADEIYLGFKKPEQELCKRVFLRLVQLGDGTEDTRRRADLKREFSENERLVIKVLADARLVTTSDDEQAYIEVSHEALIQHWGRLRKWIDYNREALRLETQISKAAKDWSVDNFESSWLLTGSRLVLAKEWLQSNKLWVSSLNIKFIDASVLAENDKINLEQQRLREREETLAEMETVQKGREKAQKRAGRFLLSGLIFSGILAILAGWTWFQAGISKGEADGLYDLVAWAGSKDLGEKKIPTDKQKLAMIRLCSDATKITQKIAARQNPIKQEDIDVFLGLYKGPLYIVEQYEEDYYKDKRSNIERKMHAYRKILLDKEEGSLIEASEAVKGACSNFSGRFQMDLKCSLYVFDICLPKATSSYY